MTWYDSKNDSSCNLTFYISLMYGSLWGTLNNVEIIRLLKF